MRYHVHVTKHKGTIRKVLNHPDVLPFMLPFQAAVFPAIDSNALNDPKRTIYSLRIDFNLAGLGVFVLKDSVATVDVCFLPEFRGIDAKEVANKAINHYMFSKYPSALVGKIRKNNPRSLIFAKWCGFHVERVDNDFYYVRRNHG